jgi:hypothetical protein
VVLVVELVTVALQALLELRGKGLREQTLGLLVILRTLLTLAVVEVLVEQVVVQTYGLLVLD